VLVFCAMEIQPYMPPHIAQGLHVLYVPLNDSMAQPMTDDEWRAAQKAGHEVARLTAGGARALTTCAMGLNRSGVVNALALHYRFGVSGKDAISRVRAARGANALHNPSFVMRLAQLRERPPIS
jgi:protein-tyrosine phosphatase